MPAQEDLWADAELISAYTDAQAVEDGVLVALWGAYRATRAVWEWLCEHLEGGQPPEGWPVALRAWCEAQTPAGRALAALGGLIGTYEAEARRIYEENAEGGILELQALLTANDQIAGLHVGAQQQQEQRLARRLWLLPNEVDGVTLMFPEDY